MKKIEEITESHMTVHQELSGGTQRLVLPYPLLAAVGSEALCPRIPSLRGRLRSKKLPIRVLRLSDLESQGAEMYGLEGSKTRVKRIYRPTVCVKAAPLVLSLKEAAERICLEAGRKTDGLE